MNMPRITIAHGAILIATGLIAYISTMVSWTALIPSIIGVFYVVFGLVALKDNLRKHAMHAAAAFSLLVILATIKGLFTLPTLLTGGEVARPTAVVVQSITAVLTIGFLALCVKSFIDARRNRVA